MKGEKEYAQRIVQPAESRIEIERSVLCCSEHVVLKIKVSEEGGQESGLSLMKGTSK